MSVLAAALTTVVAAGPASSSKACRTGGVLIWIIRITGADYLDRQHFAEILEETEAEADKHQAPLGLRRP